MDVLRYLDVFIGLALVMLLGCSVIAAVVQWITSVSRTRADYLKQGLSDIVQALDPGIPDAMCRDICELLVRHPLVSRPQSWWDLLTTRLRKQDTLWLPASQPTDALLRHEFLRIILEWASGEGVYGQRPSLAKYTERLRSAVEANGVGSPAQALAKIRLNTLMQERNNPGAPAHEWHTAAMIDACPSVLVSKVTSWYDSMSNRTSQRFKTHTQTITAIVALLLAFALPLDSIALVRRLSTDDELRKELVERAQTVVAEKTASNAPQSDPGFKEAREQLETLRSPRLAIIATNADRVAQFPGILLSWVLLSLGAPFWYDMLKNVLRFRSLIAQKDEQERKDRQETQTAHSSETAAAATTAGAAGPLLTTVGAAVAEPEDESGDLTDLVTVG